MPLRTLPDETILRRYVINFINFWGPSFRVVMATFCLDVYTPFCLRSRGGQCFLLPAPCYAAGIRLGRCIYVKCHIHIYQQLRSGRIWHKVNFYQVWIQTFPSPNCLSKAEEPSLSYYWRIAGGRLIGFIPFPRVLVLCEMQSISSRIWTRIAVSISYDYNHYTTGTSNKALYHLHSLRRYSFCRI